MIKHEFNYTLHADREELESANDICKAGLLQTKYFVNFLTDIDVGDIFTVELTGSHCAFPFGSEVDSEEVKICRGMKLTKIDQDKFKQALKIMELL